jgi:hypothetical protein
MTYCPHCFAKLPLAVGKYCTSLGCGKRLDLPAKVAPMKQPTEADMTAYRSWLLNKAKAVAERR